MKASRAYARGNRDRVGPLAQAIERYLREQDRREHAERVEKEKARGWKAVYPSLLGRCIRQTTFFMAGAPGPEPEIAALRRMAEGDRIHQKYQAWFAEMGILVGAEVRLEYKPAGISGRIDAIVHHPDRSGELLVVEIKSASDASFAEQLRANAPYKPYQDQLQLYLHLLAHHPESLAEGPLPSHQRLSGVILIENKNSQHLFEYPVEADHQEGERLLRRAQEIRGRVERIEQALHAGHGFADSPVRSLLPPPEYDALSTECYWCPYFDLCWMEALE